jgi:hypothetical protein
MRSRLLIAAVLLVALAGATYWSNKHEKAEEGKPAADAPPKVLSIPEDQIKQVELKKTDGAGLVLARGGDGKWQITSPEPLRADQDAVNSLINTVSSLPSDRLVEEKTADYSTFGLEKPGLEVTVTKKDGKTEKVRC